jgi:hypothetical protein
VPGSWFLISGVEVAEFGDELVDRVEISTRRGEGLPPSGVLFNG